MAEAEKAQLKRQLDEAAAVHAEQKETLVKTHSAAKDALMKAHEEEVQAHTTTAQVMHQSGAFRPRRASSNAHFRTHQLVSDAEDKHAFIASQFGDLSQKLESALKAKAEMLAQNIEVEEELAETRAAHAQTKVTDGGVNEEYARMSVDLISSLTLHRRRCLS